jgi:glycosyltransferase involved in cell wall biosynthesis
MPRDKQTRVALVWPRFIENHVDRCIAAARRLDGQAEVIAIEVASNSNEYSAFSPSGGTGEARKLTLFPGRTFDDVPAWRSFWAVLRSVFGCRTVCIGVPYSRLEFVLLAGILRLLGKQVVLMCDSKFDDSLRSSVFEFAKGLGLSCFSAVIVAGSRGRDYFHFLGFRRRPILFGYDTVDNARIREDAASLSLPVPNFAERDFVFVGRFIAVRNLPLLINAFARYTELAGKTARRLQLFGAGPLEPELRQQVSALGLKDRVIFAGFQSGSDLAGPLSSALALVLPSYSETWGIVVNEAVALGLPVLTTAAPGSRDALVRNLVNGYVVENGSGEGLVQAMLALGEDEDSWQAMRKASLERAWLGDAECFADAIELLLDPGAQAAGRRMAACRDVLDECAGVRSQLGLQGL